MQYDSRRHDVYVTLQHVTSIILWRPPSDLSLLPPFVPHLASDPAFVPSLSPQRDKNPVLEDRCCRERFRAHVFEPI